MKYFKNVKLDDKVYSLIFGQGRVKFVLPKKQRIDGFHIMEVEYMNKQRVHYSESGVPNWCTMNGKCQTLFFLDDIDISKMDFEPINELLTKKQIKKLKEKDRLEMRCPSGLWRNITICPERLVQKAFDKVELHLFRKAK